MCTATGRHLLGRALTAALLTVPAAAFAPGRASGAVLGRVTDAGTGRPLRGATVTARSAEAPSEAQALSASDGIFLLTPLRPGAHTITATCGGYESASIVDYPIRSAAPDRAAPGPVLFALHAPGATRHASVPNVARGARRRAPGAGRGASHLEARVRWETHGDAAHPGEPGPHPAIAGDRFVVVEVHRYPGERARQRMPELSEEQVLVVGTGATGHPRDWALVADPGLIRAESAGTDGTLAGETRRAAGTEFLVTMPQDPEIAELRFYRPRWTGTLFALELLGTARFPAPLAPSGERPGTLTPSPDR